MAQQILFDRKEDIKIKLNSPSDFVYIIVYIIVCNYQSIVYSKNDIFVTFP